MNRRAFTLLELILAMAMTAMLALTLYASFNIAYKAKRTAERTIAPMRQVGAAMETIVREFQSVPPPASSTSETLSLNGAFVGTSEGSENAEADYVEFNSLGSDDPADDSPLAGGMKHIELGIDQDQGANVLVQRITRNLLSPTEIDPAPQILCRNVKAFSIRYYDGTDWNDEWDSTENTDTLPLAVQIDLTVAVVEPGSSDAPTANAPTYHVSRLVPLSCAKPITSAVQ